MPEPCVLCNKPLTLRSGLQNSSKYKATCKACGVYISEGLEDLDLNRLPDATKAMLSSYTRFCLENSAAPPDFCSIDEPTLKGIITFYKNKSLDEKLNNLIVYIGNKSPYYGANIEITSEFDYPLTFSPNREECERILIQAETFGLISSPASRLLTWDGWRKFYDLKRSTISSKICFVAMSFNRRLDSIFNNGILGALQETGYLAIRIDRVQFNEDIFDKIIALINECKFVIADFSFHRQNVYFEAGYAKGLGKPVIHTCKKSELRSTHFDVRQNNFIVWETEAGLKEKLINRIKATIKV